MIYEYVTVNGDMTKVFCASSASFVGVTDATFAAWKASGFTVANLENNDALIFQMQRLEALQTPRRLREAALGIDSGWLKGVNDQIVAIREQIKSLG